MEESIKAILIGNPNTGKTTLFNKLTKSDEHVGNWHGVTVEEKEKAYFFRGERIDLVDLPGLYSLTTLSYEEQVARDYFLENSNRKIINICDSSNLARNLYLTLNLIEFKSDIVLAINEIDKISKNKIDINKLSKKLGIQVLRINASKGENLALLNDLVLSKKNRKVLPYINKLKLSKIKEYIANFFPKEKLDFYSIKCLEKDEGIIEKIPEDIWKKIEKEIPENAPEEIAQIRYDFIKQIMDECVISVDRIYGKSKLDNILMNKFLALPIFLLILCAIFYLTFFSVGKWFSDICVWFVNVCIGSPLQSLFSLAFGTNSWATSLVGDAIVGGVGTIFSFLPQVALLFMFLSILEDSGYLSRIAFMFEDIFSKVGLSGKSIYTILMGFGCSSSAVLTARNMEDKNAKIKTALLTPYMSCSAKFPLYVVIGGAFFGINNIFYILGLYLLGVIISILLSFIFEKTILKSKEQSFILEFPPYRVPTIKRVIKVLFENMKLFIIRVASLIISMNIIIWILSNFSFSLHYVPNSQGSMLENIGRILSPIFIPLGFGSWGIASALVAGLIAKEVILTSIIMFNGVQGASQNIIANSMKNSTNAIYFVSTASVISFLVFSLLYSPCVTTMAILKKEIGKKWTIIGVIIQFIVAYLVSLITFNIFKCIDRFGVLPVLLIIVVFLVIFISLICIIDRIKRKKVCAHNCNLCNKCSRLK